MKFCPATMCPLFAQNGSPWTGEKDAACPERHADRPGDGCAWYEDAGPHRGKCHGAGAAYQQLGEVGRTGKTLQIGPRRGSRPQVPARAYACARAHECQWQVAAGEHLCPPRAALKSGIDPRYCAY